MCGRHVVGEMGTREPVKRVVDVWVDHAIHALVDIENTSPVRSDLVWLDQGRVRISHL